MGRYIVSRLTESIIVLFIISIVAFGLVHLAPGDPAMALYGDQVQKMRPADWERIRENLGLNRPLPVQYYKWIFNVLKGDMGRSFMTGRDVKTMLLERFPGTLLLSATATVIIIGLTLVVGIYAGMRQYSFFDYASTTVSFILMSVPGFWFAMMLILVFSVGLKWLPSSGMTSIGTKFSIPDVLKHLILPAVVLSFTHLGYYIRLLRGSVAVAKEQDFVTVLKARGIKNSVIVARHILRNAMIPFVTYLGVSISIMLAGSVVTEAIFAWPGLGMLSVEAANNRDYPVLMGTILFSGALVVGGSLVVDLFCAWLDPRIALKTRPESR
ncbi:binding-protein-dependent transport system inner membrane protein [Thermincola ferriacetica]|uniref:Binding-protein-dependent transport system inner membrane protein n=1 Tax=Thermincola ferriacetica TaxID=281456 RepID=A0A0L6W7P0_9FIRM|nr:ABC transporter permease [Thermincola ferriacetica]KNZ71114.1 binding-protein-dependent transport system inner membrane protein [Thermincola ferriacetica]